MSGARLARAKAPGCPCSPEGNQPRCHALDSEAYNMCLSCLPAVFAGSSRASQVKADGDFGFVGLLAPRRPVGKVLGVAQPPPSIRVHYALVQGCVGDSLTPVAPPRSR
mmetsp:Transcript_74103/g.197573  ORF Transcript_74103/g.197573 Transcript_74103/m.197573 type:complete len:109 (+) Transcript_74103:3083-3409(+)